MANSNLGTEIAHFYKPLFLYQTFVGYIYLHALLNYFQAPFNSDKRYRNKRTLFLYSKLTVEL
jgi:hypothetical protein